MKPRDYQLEGAEKAFKILQKHMMVFAVWEERVGKSLTALMLCNKINELYQEKLNNNDVVLQNVIIITKATKQTQDGWRNIIKQCNYPFRCIITSYHSAHKIKRPNGFFMVILDESHNYITAPEQSSTWKKVRKLTYGAPLIFLTATPNPQGAYQLFWQMNLSCKSIYAKYKTYMDFYNDYGTGETLTIKPKYDKIGMTIYDIKKIDDARVFEETKHLFITLTRKEAGYEHEPNDVIHYVELTEGTKKIYNQLIKERYYSFTDNLALMIDSPKKMSHALYMLEDGVIKIEGMDYTLSNNEKVNYIKDRWGDTKDMVIMYYYVQEEKKLKKHFKNALILSADKYAEGIDLYMYEHLIIYSQDYKTGKYSQRRARQCHLDRKTPINVHFLLTRGGQSHKVYNVVALNKQDYIDVHYPTTKDMLK